MKPGQHGAGFSRHLTGPEGHHNDPSGAAPGLSQVEAQPLPRRRQIGTPLLQQHLAPAHHLRRTRTGGTQGQVHDPHGFQAGETLTLHILVGKADGQDAVVLPGGFAGPGCGPGARNRIALPPAPREEENPAG